MNLRNRVSSTFIASIVVVAIAGLMPVAGIAAVSATLGGRNGAATVAQAKAATKSKSKLTYKNQYTLVANYDFLKGPRKNSNGTFNVAIEIPAGTSQKWETSTTATNVMYWEFKKGKPRVISYLPYVGNYGSLVNSKADDGDPLDVLVLAPAVTRGTIQKVRIIGVLKVSEPDDSAPGGKVTDDKLIAVADGAPLAGVSSLAALNAGFPGVTSIVRTWFENYKGAGAMTFEGWGEAAEATAMADSVPAFK